MSALIEVILPVFLVIGFGYVAVWRGWLAPEVPDGLMTFSQNFAIPCLLFVAISTLDLGQSFNLALLGSFYAGATLGFTAGLLGGRFLFGRSWEDAVAIGFCCLFSNSLLLGLSITEQAYGPDALEANYAIIAVHAPFCYGLGITAMEIVRARGRGLARTGLAGAVLSAMFRNVLILAVLAGFVVNLSGLSIPGTLRDALDLMIRAALPTALFALGGVLVRYRPEGDLRAIGYVCAVALLLHPAITFGLGRATGLSVDGLRSAVVTGAMAPGINTYIFANMYGAARRVAASSVLLGTALSILTTWAWLAVLP